MQRNQIVELDGGEALFVKRRGRGAPTILLHGALTTHTDWGEPLLSALEPSCDLFLVDRPGHGRSIRPRFAASPLLQARVIHEAVAQEISGPRILVAHSFGAMVALAYATLFPDSTAGLVLISPVSLPEFRVIDHLYLMPRAIPVVGKAITVVNSAVDPLFLKVIHRLMFAPHAPPREWEARYPWNDMLTPGAFTVNGEDSISPFPASLEHWRELSQLDIPVRIIAGLSDAVAPLPLHRLAIARAMRDVKIIELEGVGHMPHHFAAGRVADEILTLAEQLRSHGDMQRPHQKADWTAQVLS